MRYGRPTVPTITIFNQATTPLGVDLRRLVRALRRYVDDHLAPAWGTPAKLVLAKSFRRDAWALAFFDSARAADDDGFHELTDTGLPFARVFVNNALETDGAVSVTASHELAEMLVDPDCTTEIAFSDRVLYDYEVADPVEQETFQVDGLPMSDFVYPAWFESFHERGSVRFDHLGRVRAPFEVHRNGYARRFWGGKWRNVYGSSRKEERFTREDRAGYRSTIRHARRRWRRSTA